MGGFGLWPRTIFSNQLCLAGPASDPAKVRGSRDLVTAFRKIAKAKAPYVVNRTKGIKYLTEMLWYAADQPAKGNWLIDAGASKKEAFALAAERKAYVIWGLTPFLREEHVSHNGLVPLLTADPILQRIMVAIVVNPTRFPAANVLGATALQQFLLSPETQAAILKTRYEGYDQALWVPAGRHNAGAALPI
jgi:tungstate transport system substrate-binding protein